MIICTNCSARNQDAERFCGECGTYLEWEGQRVEPARATPEPEPVAAPTPSAEPRPGHPGLIERILASSVRTAEDRATTGAADDPPATVDAPGAPGDPSPPATDARPQRRPVTSAHGAPAPTASTTTAPDTAPRPAAAIGPSPVGATGFGVTKPTEPDDRPPPPPPPPPDDDDPPPAPGDLICGSCGAGNVPTRKFCRRCGRDLADAPVAVQPPWWRRLRRRRSPTVTAAGTRPGKRRRHRVPSRALGVLLLLASLGAAAWFGRDALQSAVLVVQDRVTDVEAVRPVDTRASLELPGREAGLAVDGTRDRSWSPGAADTAVGQLLQLSFEEPFRLVSVVVRPGASDQQQQFLLEARPEDLVISATRPDGTVVTETFRLVDEAGEQTLRMAVDDVEVLTVTIGSVYPAQDPAAPVALAEVEVFGRR